MSGLPLISLDKRKGQADLGEFQANERDIVKPCILEKIEGEKENL